MRTIRNISRKIANSLFRKILELFEKNFRRVWYKKRMNWQQKVGVTALALLIISSFFIFDYIHTENSRQYLTVVFLDVGQGDAIFIEAPNGNQVLIDSGPTATVIRQLSEVLPFYDRSLDLIIATHHDSDHTAAFPEILKRYNVAQYGTSPNDDDDSLFFEIERLVEEENADRLTLTAGDRITLDKEKNIYIDILWPPADVVIEDNNESSVVTQLVYGNTSFMLTGDLGQEGEEEIVSAAASELNNLNIKSQVLKAGHHGSRTSTAPEFVAAVEPDYVIISAGLDNKFGHPHEETLKVISDWSDNFGESVEILETYNFGNIFFQSDGEKVWLKVK